MGIRKVGKYYWLDIRIGDKRIRRSLRTDKKFTALDRYKASKDKLLEEHSEHSIKFADFCKQYLEWAWNTKPKTAIREEQRLKKIQAFFDSLEVRAMDDINPYHIEQFKSEFRQRGLTKATVNMYLSLLRNLFNRAIDWEIYKKPNPLKRVKFYRVLSDSKAISEADMTKVLGVIKEMAGKPHGQLQAIFYDLVLFGLNTGMRRSEVLNLRWRDVKDGAVEIIGKGDKRRIVPLNETALQIIAKQPRRSEYVFDVDCRNSASKFEYTTKLISERSGVKFHYHLLRHYFTTKLLEKGVDIVTIGTILGHSHRKMSLLYSHTDRDKMKKAVEILENEKA